MAIAFDSSAIGSGSTTLSITIGSGQNRILFVEGSVNGGNSITGVTYNGVAMTLIDVVTSGGTVNESLWYLVNPTSGTNNIIATTTGGFCRLSGSSYTGVLQASPIEASAKLATSSTPFTSTVSASTTGDWHVMGAWSTATITAGSLTTSRTGSSDHGMYDSNGIVSGTSVLTCTLGGSFLNANVGCTFKPASTVVGGSSFFFNFL